jgi:hypothetical protein
LRGRRICIGTATIFPRAQLVRPVLTHLLRGSSESFRGPRCLSIPRRHIGPEKHHRSWGFGPQHRCWSRLAHHQDRRAERTCIARPTFLRVTERKTRSAKAWLKRAVAAQSPCRGMDLQRLLEHIRRRLEGNPQDPRLLAPLKERARPDGVVTPRSSVGDIRLHARCTSFYPSISPRAAFSACLFSPCAACLFSLMNGSRTAPHCTFMLH